MKILNISNYTRTILKYLCDIIRRQKFFFLVEKVIKIKNVSGLILYGSETEKKFIQILCK